MEQDRWEKGRELGAGVVLVVPDRRKRRREELAKDKDRGAEDAVSLPAAK